MADRVLREPCDEHGRYEEHSVMWTDNRTTSSYTGPCPGGREVTIDREAAGKAAWRVVATEEGLIDEGLEWDDLTASDSQPFWIDVGKAAVDAALGVADDDLTASRHYFDEAAKRDG